jgi:two-component system chemotaxis response regulator CheB
MKKIRVLIVDDAVVVRRMVSEALVGDPALEVVGTAANGRIALAKIPQVNPEVVTLDVEMPEMNGLETLAAIRKQYPALPVIMFSTLTQRGAATTIDALSLGANDYVTKPTSVGSVDAAIKCLREQLIPKVKLWCSRVPRSDFTPTLAAGRGKIPARTTHLEVVAIGVSTGGPNALSALLPALPSDFRVPVVLVQHMPPLFTRLLAERLAAHCALSVKEATAGDEIRPGHVYVAPGDYHMLVRREGPAVRIQTHQGPPENSCRPAVDVLFRSVAEVYGPGVLGVVLTGMGQDGFRGCESIREVGGQVIVQDETTSVVWGMPGFVARAGLADEILPLDRLAPEILRRVGLSRTRNPERIATCH